MLADKRGTAKLTAKNQHLLQNTLQEQLESLMRIKYVKHAIIAVESMDGSFKWAGAAGIACPDETPMKTSTPFWIASVTKLFIAAAILRLCEEERLSLDDLIATHLPEALIQGIHQYKGKDYSQQITIKNLLEHSSGLPDYLVIHRKNEKSIFNLAAENIDSSWTIAEIAQIIREAGVPHFAPQSSAVKNKIHYSDTNYQFLVAIIESVTGNPLHTVFEEMFYQPLALCQTFHPGTALAEKHPVASVWYQHSPLNIPGAMRCFRDLNSTAGDLLTFMRALLRGQVFHNSDTVKLMTGQWNQFGFSVSPVGPGWPIEYGLGIMRFSFPRFLAPFNTVPAIMGHTGASGSWLFYCPSLEILLTGSVSQATAAAVPFQTVPKMLKVLMPYFNQT